MIPLTRMFRRELGLPDRYVVLAATDENALLLNCDGADSDSGAVYSVPCSKLALFALGISAEGSHCWPNFVDFFATVLEHEEA